MIEIQRLTSLLTNLNFPAPYPVINRVTVADIFPPDARVGIYVLHFANGELYAGKSNNVSRRFAKHSKTYSDITQLSFKEVPLVHLDEAEREVIYALESAGFLLRNIVHTSFPFGPNDFDEVMTPADQDRWRLEMDYVDIAGLRLENEDLRRKYQQRFNQFQGLPCASDIYRVFGAYMHWCLPAYRRSEISFWSSTCLPENNSGVDIYARINIYWMETLTVYSSLNRLHFSFHLAKIKALNKLRNKLYKFTLLAKYQGVVFYHSYRPGGQDQINIDITGAENALRFIRSPEGQAAMRQMNLNLMRKGACNAGRNHCVSLADEMYRHIPDFRDE